MFIDITHPLMITGVAIGILLIGFIVGSLYYILMAQVSLEGKIELSTGNQELVVDFITRY